MGTIGSEQTFEDSEGKTTWVGDKKVSEDKNWIGNEKIGRDPSGKITKIGERIVKRDSYGKITDVGEDKVTGNINFD